MSKDFQTRLNNITGQLSGVKNMMLGNSDAYEVIIQLKAARSGIDSLIKEFASKELSSCLNLSLEQRDVCNKFLKEISKII